MPFRAFIAVEVGDAMQWSDLRAELASVDRAVRPVRPELVHVTLRFLGDTDEGLVDGLGDVMRAAVEGVGPFTIDLEGVGAFPNPRRPRVVWVGMRGAEPLAEIASRLERGVVSMGFRPEGRAFRPHITCARVKNLRGQGALAGVLERWAGRGFGRLEVGSIVLKRSVLTPQGPVYSTLLEVPLPLP